MNKIALSISLMFLLSSCAGLKTANQYEINYKPVVVKNAGKDFVIFDKQDEKIAFVREQMTGGCLPKPLSLASHLLL